MTADYNDAHIDLFAPDGVEMLESTDPEAVRALQDELGVATDGFLGPQTIDALARTEADDGIVLGPRRYAMDRPVETYIEDFEWGDTGARTRREAPRQIILHYDVAFTARKAEEILEARDYSTHFIIDGDAEATIYQCHDPATKVAYHAGAPNGYSIGIDLNNPAAPKYQEADAQRRGRTRTVREQTIHGRKIDRLDYFPEQIEALNELLDLLCNVFEIPRTTPRLGGNPVSGVLHGPSGYEGILGHYHWSEQKTDPAPLNWSDINA